MVELSTRISWERRVYRPRRLISEVRMVVSFALKKRAAMPPKPQSVSSDRTAKGKARRFLFLLAAGAGTVSNGIFSRCWPKEDTEAISMKKIMRRALMMVYIVMVSFRYNR